MLGSECNLARYEAYSGLEIIETPVLAHTYGTDID